MKDELKEPLQHGDLLLRMKVYHTCSDPFNKMVLYAHWHEEMELLVIARGKARVQLDGISYEVSAGEYLFIKPYTLHAAYSLGEERVEFYAIVVHADFLASLIQDTVSKKYIAPLFDGSAELPVHLHSRQEQSLGCLPLLQQIKSAYMEKADGYELLIKARLFEVLHKLYRSASPRLHAGRKVDNRNLEALRRVIQLVHKRYAEKITLDELAAEAHMSKGYFCRLFHKHFAMTPIDYVNSFRIAQAAMLLAYTDRKLIDIALCTGFGSGNYLTIAFKKYFQCTPSQYKRRQTLASEEKGQYPHHYGHDLERLSSINEI